MCGTWKSGAARVILVYGCGMTMLAQGPIGSQLRIDVQDWTIYVLSDVDPSQLGKNLSPGPVAWSGSTALYGSQIDIGDIVAVNGSPAKGTVFLRETSILATANFKPGAAIADVSRGGFYEWTLELMNPDNTLVGSIRVSGMAGGGPRPPGAPSVIARAGYMVVAGTGPFLGARGYFQSTPDPARPERFASAAEDPAYRRINGGGNVRLDLYLIPMMSPEVVSTPGGPAVVHANDNTLVTAAKPAKSGEILSLFATGLGPTRPGLEPGAVFSANPLQVVNSPVQVTVAGQAADVLYAGGYPGSTDGYQVNFRVPSGAAPGLASLQLAAAWIAGPAVKIAIQ